VNDAPVMDILMFKQLRKEGKNRGKSDKITTVEEKVIRLDGLLFH
jgi:hypothetical protein